MPSRAQEHKRAEDPLIHAAMISPRSGTGHPHHRPLSTSAPKAASYVPTTQASLGPPVVANSFASTPSSAPARLSLRGSPRFGPPRKSSTSPLRTSLRGQRLQPESAMTTGTSTAMRIQASGGGSAVSTASSADCHEPNQRLSLGKVVSPMMQDSRVVTPRQSRHVFKASDKLQAHPLCASIPSTLSSSTERSRPLRAGPSRSSGRSSSRSCSQDSQGYRRDIRTPNISGCPRGNGLQDSRCSSRASTPATGSRCSSPTVSVSSRAMSIGRPSFGVGRACLNAGRAIHPGQTIIRQQATAPVADHDRHQIPPQVAPYAQGILQQVRRVSTSSRTARTSTVRKTESRSVSPRQGPTDVELEEDVEVRIDNCTCRITGALGMGSFGTVWAAEDLQTGEKLAVKEILCSTQNEMANAHFESHLLDQLSRAPGPYSMRSPYGSDIIGTMPALVGHHASASNPREPIRVRLAMTRVPGVALEDFLEGRRMAARVGENPAALGHPMDRFSEACSMTRELIVQLAPVFRRIHRIAVHRDVNTHNILVDASEKIARFGIVDFGLAVDKICWCSNDEEPLTQWRPTRFGQDGVYTWKYLDIAGDCRYWPVSAWTQFLIGWREIESDPCLEKEYKLHLDQHALGITALKLFSELMLIPLSKNSDANNADASDIDGSPKDVPKAVWYIVDAWRNYWRTVGPVHKRLINTFHHGGDWDALKQMCTDTNFYSNIAKDLVTLREALAEAAESCQQMAAECTFGSESSNTNAMAMSSRLFRAMLILVSDGQTKDMLSGPQAWEAIRCMLSQCNDTGLASDSPELPVASHCSSTASTVESQGAAKFADGQAQKLTYVLPS